MTIHRSASRRMLAVLFLCALLLPLTLALASCGHPVDGIHTFHATVIEVNGRLLLIEPDANTYERSYADRIELTVPETNFFTIEAGDRVEIIYHEGIEETYPAKIEKVIDVVPESGT